MKSMRLCVALASVLAALAETGLSAGTATPKRHVPGVSHQALIAAAKHAMLSDINYGRPLCGEDRTVEVWLNDVVGGGALPGKAPMQPGERRGGFRIVVA